MAISPVITEQYILNLLWQAFLEERYLAEWFGISQFVRKTESDRSVTDASAATMAHAAKLVQKVFDALKLPRQIVVWQGKQLVAMKSESQSSALGFNMTGVVLPVPFSDSRGFWMSALSRAVRELLETDRPSTPYLSLNDPKVTKKNEIYAWWQGVCPFCDEAVSSMGTDAIKEALSWELVSTEHKADCTWVATRGAAKKLPDGIDSEPVSLKTVATKEVQDQLIGQRIALSKKYGIDAPEDVEWDDLRRVGSLAYEFEKAGHTIIGKEFDTMLGWSKTLTRLHQEMHAAADVSDEVYSKAAGAMLSFRYDLGLLATAEREGKDGATPIIVIDRIEAQRLGVNPDRFPEKEIHVRWLDESKVESIPES